MNYKEKDTKMLKTISPSTALNFYNNEKYEEALKIYELLSQENKQHIYDLNIELCKNKIEKNSKSTNIIIKKRICIITHELTYTGAPGSSLRMAICLKNLYDIEIVSPKDGDFRNEIERNNIKLKIIPESKINTSEIKNYFKNFDLIICNSIATSEFVKHLKDYTKTIWYIREAQNIKNYHMGRQNQLKGYPFIVSVSEYAAEFIRKNYSQNVQVLNNFVLDKYSGEPNNIENKIKLMFCGTISSRKGLDILLNAINNLNKNLQNQLELHIVGRKLECFNDYIYCLKELLNKEWVIDHGEISNEDIKFNLFKKMNIFIIPSRDESFSNVTLEALMLGKPVIISDHVGAKELLNNDCAFIFKNENIEDLKDKLTKIINNKALIQSMGKNARKVYELSCTYDVFKNKFLENIENWLKIKKINQKQNYFFRTYNDLIHIIKTKTSQLRQLNISSIIGIPRSGMIPAYMIGNLLNIPVYSINEFISNTKNSLTGRTLEVRNGNIMVIDDSVLSGNSINKAKKMLSNKKNNFIYAAVYATQKSKDYVDFYFEQTNMPRIFEWNYLNHPNCINWAFDIDGVLCIDPTEEENDDGEKYINFILNAKPLFIPKYTIGALITSRLEKYRKYTEYWLKQNNIKYNHLIMLDLPSKKERIKQKAHAKIKWQHYKERKDLILFIESEESQAIEIANNSGKDVICTKNNKLYRYVSESSNQNASIHSVVAL